MPGNSFRDLEILTRREQAVLRLLIRRHEKRLRKRNPSGKMIGIQRVPSSPEIDEFFRKITEKRNKSQVDQKSWYCRLLSLFSRSL